MTDIQQWLVSLDLGEHAAAFEKNAIDWNVLPELTEAHLKEIGIPLGHRLRILKAIEALTSEDAALRGPPAPPKSRAASRPAATTAAERRQLTVMFCDLVGSSALAEQLDPEDLRKLLEQYQDCCAAVISQFDGYIARYIGDGLLVYFGYPQAHEGDAERAVRAGLGILRATQALNDEITHFGVELAVRIGITTGLVVAGDIGSGDRREHNAIVGETPNLAARLQAMAAPNAVLIGASTQRLVEDLFDCDDLGEQRVKGMSQPVRAYRVRAESDAPSGFEAKAARGLTPLVGREGEVELLLKRWNQAKEGEGQVILLSGEAGIGKSRITRGFQDRLGDIRNRVLYHGSPYHQNSALYPAIDQLERALRFQRNDTAAQKLDKLETVLNRLDLPVEDHAPFLASLLSLPFDGRYRDLDLNPQELKNNTLRVIVTVIERMAAKETVLMVVEDAQWIDPSTIELITFLIEQARATRLLLVITYRPEFEPPWGRYPHITALTLNRLSQRETIAMIAKITQGKALPDEVLDQIVARTDGVPLFVEELTKAVLEAELLKDAGDHFTLAGPLPPLAIPASIQDSLLARLDRFPSVKVVAELAATCGRTFNRELLLAVSSWNEDVIDNALSALLDAGLVYRRGFPPNYTYEFKHALVQDAAYQTLLKSTRQQYHQAIARALEEQFPDTADTQPEVVARHYTEAGLVEQAIPFWYRAGQRAVMRSGNLEAVAQLTKGLDLIKALESTPARARQELDFYLALGPALVATRGFADTRVGQAYARAGELGQLLEDHVHLPLILRGTQVFHLLSGDLTKARVAAERFLELAERLQDPALLVGSYHALGQTLFFHGELTAARRTVEQGIALFDAKQHRLPNWPGGQPGEQCFLYSAFSTWALGFPDQALQRAEQALALAKELANPTNLINTLCFIAVLHVFRREPAAARQLAKEAVRISYEQRNPTFIGYGRSIYGWARAAEGETQEGIAEIQEGITTFRATGARTWLPFFLGLQAEACARTEHRDDGLALLAEALSLVQDTDQRAWEADLYRIRGQLLGRSPDHCPEAESNFAQALDTARRQQAKSWELRAALELARLWQNQDKSSRAYGLLAPIYGFFTEGFDTRDLKDTRALLDSLA